MTEDVSRCWTADWTEVILKYGMDVLTESLTRHRKASNFLPLAHDLNVHASAVVAERADSKRRQDTHRVLSELEQWKRQCRAEGTEWVHPDMLMKQMEQEVFMMRDACEAAFGEDWRTKFRGRDLTDVYAEAMRP